MAAKKTAYDLPDETKARIKILSAQGNAHEDEVVQLAIDLLYTRMPNDRDARISIPDMIKKEQSAIQGEPA